LGNIPSDEVVALETLRLGLRSDTLDLLPETDERPRTTDAEGPVPSSPPLFH
jgi:phosphosulfolactate synthase